MMGLRGESMNPMTFGNMIHPKTYILHFSVNINADMHINLIIFIGVFLNFSFVVVGFGNNCCTKIKVTFLKDATNQHSTSGN